MADVNTSILQALEAGYHPQEIMNHIKNSDDPSHQEWYSNYSTNMADRAKEPSAASIYYNDGSGVTTQDANTTPTVKSTSNTPLLDWAQTLTPREAATAGAVAVGVAKAPGLINAYQDRKLKREDLAQKERSLAAYESQVAKQGTVGQPANAPMQEPTLNPLEEARINTERARAEAIQAKIALEERKVAAMEAKVKADAERKAANVPTPKPKEPVIELTPKPSGIVPPSAPVAGVAPPVPAAPTVPLTTEVGNPPKDMGLVKAGEANTVKNLIAEEIKPAPTLVEPAAPVVEKSVPPPKAPKAKVDMPAGWGKGMTWLVNQHGVEGAQAFIDAKNNGKPFASYDEMMKSYQENTTRPKYSDIPKDVRKSRGISKAVVPPLPSSGGGMGVAPRPVSGGKLNETGRPGEEIIHNLNPLKL
jgi:hypothetical protein